MKSEVTAMSSVLKGCSPSGTSTQRCEAVSCQRRVSLHGKDVWGLQLSVERKLDIIHYPPSPAAFWWAPVHSRTQVSWVPKEVGCRILDAAHERALEKLIQLPDTHNSRVYQLSPYCYPSEIIYMPRSLLGTCEILLHLGNCHHHA